MGYNAKLVNSAGLNGGESLEVQIPTLYGGILFSISYANETSLFFIGAWNAIVDVKPIVNNLTSFEIVANAKSISIKNKTSSRIGISYGWHNLTNI